MAMGSSVLIIFAVGWLILFFWLLFVTLSISKINKREKAIREAGKNEDFVQTVEASLAQLSSLRDDVQEVKANHAGLQTAFSSTIQRVGVVRFDAFDDIGGKLSFAVALLNDHGDGAVISSINGRQESRSYAKEVVKGDSKQTLSEEERQAISKALFNNKDEALVK